ncbi:RING finger protein 37 [Atheta coriaria]|uniref:RING finger protein 37 n=1 Tax=Dalotia coriaria TaxID=877792 RepID=UPI0031F3A47E
MCDSKFYDKQNPPTSNTNSYTLSYFKSFQHRVFTNTNKLCVRILRTDSRSVPCLGSVEVWGYIGKNCSQETKQTVHKLMHRSDEKHPGRTKMQNILTNSKNGEFTIPEDFKDALTCEVMALPMTLPSGNTIDQVTLEKCISNDVMYGRKAVDPFTGLEFLPNRKPVLNVALKSRIDLFLLKHGDQDETKTIGRTLGSSKQENQQTSYGDKNNRKTNYSTELRVEIPQKIQKAVDNTSECNQHSTGDNLDDAIAKVMGSGSFMCFTSFEKSQPANTLKKTCHKCKCDANLYEITVCRHLFCRPCLITLCNTCSMCKRKFVNGAVVKINVT